MTQKEKRIKIAEACGWSKPLDSWRSPVGQPGFLSVPDYFTDLNAIHEAEKMLITRGGLDTYIHFLRYNEVVEDDKPWYGEIHATAAQRAEAFGLTLNLWNLED